MKIIYDDIIFNLQKYGGISRYFKEMIERVRKSSGVGVGIFKGFKGRLARFNDILIGNKFKTGKYDIYHPTYYSCLVKKRKDIKTVVTVYDMIHELYLGNGNQSDSGIVIKKQSIMNADHLICISKSTKKDLQRIYGIEDDRISVIYLGTSLARQGIKTRTISHKSYILYVGKRGLYKNFSTLLNAFYDAKMNKDFDLVCFGGGNFSKEEMLEFKKMSIWGSVKYIEGSDGLLQMYYENASVFVYPSIYEGFGLPVLEAMTFGCPVIASNASSIPEIADNAAMLFFPKDVEGLGSCIKRMVSDKSMRQDYIEKGKKRCMDFSWEKTADETLMAYRKVLNKC